MIPLKTTVRPVVGIHHRLRAHRGQVDDGQPPVPQRHRAAGPDAGAVGAALLQAGRHPLQRRRRRRAASVEAHLTCESAHVRALRLVGFGHDPGVLGPAAPRAVDDQAARRGDAGQAQRCQPAVLPGGSGQVDERPQVHAPRLEPPVRQAGQRGQGDDLLRDPAGRGWRRSRRAARRPPPPWRPGRSARRPRRSRRPAWSPARRPAPGRGALGLVDAAGRSGPTPAAGARRGSR